MALNKGLILRWLFILALVSGIAFVFSFPANALDPRIVERLPMGYSEDSEIEVKEGVFDPDTYGGGNRAVKEKKQPSKENEKLAETPPEETTPDYLDSGQVLDSGTDPQQQLYDDVSSIRRSIEIIVYFVIPFTVGAILIYKFCVWFYSTFIESAWDK